MTEKWVIFFMHYQVSNLGRVRSKNKILKAPLDKGGYHRLSLRGWYSNKRKIKSLLVHRIVATAFIENPYDKSDVNHIDGCKTNNKVNNLSWATKSENRQHAFNTGLQSGKKGVKHWNSRLTEKQVTTIFKSNKLQYELAKKYNVTQAAISNIKTGKSWPHLRLNK